MGAKARLLLLVALMILFYCRLTVIPHMIQFTVLLNCNVAAVHQEKRHAPPPKVREPLSLDHCWAAQCILYNYHI